jgi:hypothetical protein
MLLDCLDASRPKLLHGLPKLPDAPDFRTRGRGIGPAENGAPDLAVKRDDRAPDRTSEKEQKHFVGDDQAVGCSEGPNQPGYANLPPGNHEIGVDEQYQDRTDGQCELDRHENAAALLQPDVQKWIQLMIPPVREELQGEECVGGREDDEQQSAPPSPSGRPIHIIVFGCSRCRISASPPEEIAGSWGGRLSASLLKGQSL